MALSIFLAKVIGLLFVIMGLLFFFYKKNFKIIFKAMANEEAMVLSGYLSLVLGLCMVVGHDFWYGGIWRVIITLIGWLALIKGIVRLACPKYTVKMIHKLRKKDSILQAMVVFMMVLGAYLAYMGFSL